MEAQNIDWKSIDDFSCILKDTKLTPEQNRAIQILTRKRSRILSYQAGLGKTTICITAAKIYKIRNPNVKTIFVFPKSARASFKKEFANRTNDKYALFSTDEIIDYEGQDYILCENMYLEKIVPLIEDLAEKYYLACFYDEAHYLQNKNSNLHKTIESIKNKLTIFHAVTATPLINSIEGLFNILNLVDPENNSSWFVFRNKYCVVKQKKAKIKSKKTGRTFERKFDEIVGYKNLDDLKKYIDTICIQGGITYNLNFIYKQTNLDENIKKQYRDASKGVFKLNKENQPEEVTDDIKAYGARLHDLQRIVDGDYFEDITNKTKLLLYQLMEINKKNTEATLIYAEYDDTVELLKKYIEEYKEKINVNTISVIDGKTKEEERVRIETSIVPRDVVIITAAGRQSRNLQRANNFIFYDLPFSVGTITQCIGRVCRVDSKYKEQNVYIIETQNTIDTYKKLIFNKNIGLIKQLFNCQTTLPLDMLNVELHDRDEMKKSLLWCKNCF